MKPFRVPCAMHSYALYGKSNKNAFIFRKNGNEKNNNNNNNEFNWTLETMLKDKRTTITIFYIFLLWNKWSLYPANRLLCHLTEEEEEENIHIFWFLTAFIRSFVCIVLISIYFRFTFQKIVADQQRDHIHICDAQIYVASV